MRRASLALLVSAFTLLVFAASAMASQGHDGGEGWWGETDDKVVTYSGFIVIAAIPLFIFLMSMLQWQLDKRKDRRKAAAKARGTRREWRGGW